MHWSNYFYTDLTSFTPIQLFLKLVWILYNKKYVSIIVIFVSDVSEQMLDRYQNNIGSTLRVCWSNTRHWSNIELMLGHRLRSWPNIKLFLAHGRFLPGMWVIGGGNWAGDVCVISHSLDYKQTRGIDPILVQCWATVYDDGPTLNQYWVNASRLLA